MNTIANTGLMEFRARLHPFKKARAVKTQLRTGKAEPGELFFWNSNMLFIFVCDTSLNHTFYPLSECEPCVCLCEDILETVKMVYTVQCSAKFAEFRNNFAGLDECIHLLTKQVCCNLGHSLPEPLMRDFLSQWIAFWSLARRKIPEASSQHFPNSSLLLQKSTSQEIFELQCCHIWGFCHIPCSDWPLPWPHDLPLS